MELGIEFRVRVIPRTRVLRLVLLHHAPTAVYDRVLCIEYRLSVQRSVMLILSEIAVIELSQWVVRIRERLGSCGTSMMDCLALVWQ
jgi:hypothetical protein